MKRFESLSAALLDQIESNVCVSEYKHEDADEDDDDNIKMTDMSGEVLSCIFRTAIFVYSYFKKGCPPKTLNLKL